MLLFVRRHWIWFTVGAVLLFVWLVARRRAVAASKDYAPGYVPYPTAPPPPPPSTAQNGDKTSESGWTFGSIGTKEAIAACIAKGGDKATCEQAAGVAEEVRSHIPFVWGLDKLKSYF